jgi:hypothetical protein
MAKKKLLAGTFLAFLVFRNCHINDGEAEGRECLESERRSGSLSADLQETGRLMIQRQQP